MSFEFNNTKGLKIVNNLTPIIVGHVKLIMGGEEKHGRISGEANDRIQVNWEYVNTNSYVINYRQFLGKWEIEISIDGISTIEPYSRQLAKAIADTLGVSTSSFNIRPMSPPPM